MRGIKWRTQKLGHDILRYEILTFLILIINFLLAKNHRENILKRLFFAYRCMCKKKHVYMKVMSLGNNSRQGII